MDHIAANVYIETDYSGVNVGAYLSLNGTIAIDIPSYPREARDWAMQLHRLDKQPLQHLILTNCHGDRILNARWLNAPILAHQETSDRLYGYDKRFPQALIESLVTRNSEKGRDFSNSPIEKPAISFTGHLQIIRKRFQIELIDAQGAHPGNIWVHLPDEGVLFTGDTLVVDRHPLLAEANSAAWLTSLSKLSEWQKKVNVIVPGRGPVATGQAIESLQHYIQLMRQKVESLVIEDKPVEETAVFIPEFLSMFPIHHLPTEWVKRQIKLSLARVYDEIQYQHTDNREETS
ncbi:MAG: MBL fold metallo-hydrolase [Chloroflexi bacterium]|nr:MBL fold metallo-hydrolase [Chloroflexota bacterium]